MTSSAVLAHTEAAHLVRFYSTDDELVGAVVQHIRDTDLGAAGIVVATASHREAITAQLARQWPDAAPDALVMLDADTTLHRFFDGERVDPKRFDEVIGTLIRRCARPGRPLRVYGEMVSVLWDAGNVTAALELEQLWNELATTSQFSLLCGYPTHSTVAGADAIRRVCAAHSAVLGPSPWPSRNEVRRSLAPGADTPAQARRFVTATLSAWGVVEELDDIVLVADELVTNALVHAASDVAVTLTSTADSIQVAVADNSPVAPRPAHRGASSTSGRGLHIVNVLASAWGHHRNGTGKIVWARFDAQFTTS